MKRYQGVKFNSLWDKSTWGLLALTMFFCILPIFFDDDGILPLILCGVIFVFVIAILCSVYYRIDGNQLIVYELFIPKAYPIMNITEIAPTKSILSAPATSLIHRMAIKFDDRKILKSVMPLVISPVRQDEFLSLLKKINPDIKINY